MKIAVVRETAPGETRVAATPETVKKFIGLGAELAVEAGAGDAASISDADYEAAGATAGPHEKVIGGADIVIDPVGGDRVLDSLRSLNEQGRFVVVGFTGGAIPEIKVNRLLLNNLTVVGAGWGAFSLSKPHLNAEVQEEIDRLIASGHVRPVVGARFPLERATDALETIDERRALGKIVLEL